MNLKLALTGILLTSSCSSEFEEAKRNFIPISDLENYGVIDDWRAHDINKPFKDDCDGFAFSLQKVIGGDVWLVKLPDTHHAVLVKDGWVYDNLYINPIPLDSYSGKLIRIIELKDNPN